MAFEVSIKITAESQLEAVKAAEAAVQKIGTTAKQVSAQSANLNILGPGMIETVKSSGHAAAGLVNLRGAAAAARPVIGAVATGLMGAGGAAGLFGRGLAGLAFGGLGPVGIALLGTQVALGAWSAYSDAAKEKAKALEEQLKTLADAGKQIRNIGAQIEQAGKALEAKTNFAKIEADQEKGRRGVREQFEKLITDEKLTGEQQAALRQQRNEKLAALDELGIKTHIARARDLADAVGKVNAVEATNVQQSALRSAKAAEEAGALNEVANAYRRVAEAAEFRLKVVDSAEKAARGGKAGEGFTSAFGDIGKQLSEMTKYGAQFGFLDEGKLQNLNLLIQGFGKALEKEFGIDIPPALQATQQRFQGIIDQLAQKYKVQLDTVDAQDALNQATAKLDEFSGKVATPIKLIMDPSGIKGIFDDASSMLDALRAKAAVPIIQEINVVVTKSSPTLPFSEYFGPGGYAEGVLSDFANNAAAMPLNFNTDLLTPIVNTLDAISRARLSSAHMAGLLLGPQTGIHPSFYDTMGNWNNTLIAEGQKTLAFLMNLAGRTGGGGAGGGGINLTINNDFTNSVVTSDAAAAIVRDLPKQIASAVRSATGVDVSNRVHN